MKKLSKKEIIFLMKKNKNEIKRNNKFDKRFHKSLLDKKIKIKKISFIYKKINDKIIKLDYDFIYDLYIKRLYKKIKILLDKYNYLKINRKDKEIKNHYLSLLFKIKKLFNFDKINIYHFDIDLFLEIYKNYFNYKKDIINKYKKYDKNYYIDEIQLNNEILNKMKSIYYEMRKSI